MILLFPVVLAPEEEAVLLAERPGGPLAARPWLALSRAPGVRVVVAGGAEVLALARECGVEGLELGGAEGADTGAPFLPPGTAQALAQARGAGLIRPGEVAGVADCRHALLDAEALALAREVALEPGRVAVAVVPARDHPIQMEEHLRLVWSGAFAPLDPDFRLPGDSEGARRATRPFPFAWPFYLDAAFFLDREPGPGPYAVLVRRDDPSVLQIVPEELAPEFHGALSSRLATLAREDGERARLVLDPVREPLPVLPGGWRVEAVPLLPGAEAFPGPGGIGVVAARDPDSGRLGLFVRRGLLSAGLVLRLAVHAGGRERVAEQRLSARDLRGSGEWIGPLALLDPGKVGPPDFLSVLVLKPSRGGTLHRREPLELSGGLWRRLPSTGRAVNAATGQVVSGRQMFPEVWEPRGGLALGRAEDLSALARGRERPLVGFVPASEHCLRVASAFGLVELRARLRVLGRDPEEFL